MTRSLLVALALATVAPLAFHPVDAHAAEAPVPPNGLVEILAPPALRTDAGPVDVVVVAYAPDGSGLSGLKLKADASTGNAGSMKELAPGVYSFSWTPSGAAPTVQFSVKGKGAVSPFTASLEVALPVPAGPASLISNPSTVTLGAAAEATVSLNASGTPAIRVTTGSFQALTPMGSGKFTTKYVGPGVPFPHLAVVTVADQGDPAGSAGWAVIPLEGSVPFPVSGPAGASVVLKVDGKEFGPVQLDASGQGTVPIRVPPGVTAGTQTTVVNGVSTDSPLDLKVPETRRIALYPLPAAVPVGASAIPVRLVALDPSGKPRTDAQVALSASKGAIGAPRSLGNGVWAADWTPPAEAGEVTLTASVDGSKVQLDELKVQVVPARPAKATVVVDPAEIGPDTTSVRVTAKLLTADGKPADGATLEVGASGRATAKSTDGKAGDYTATIDVKAGTAATLSVLGHGAASKNPVHDVVVLAPTRIADDGASSIPLVVVAVDRWGHPVANQDVTVSLVTGNGALSSTALKTDAGGIARLDYTAGSAAQVVRIRASSGSAAGWANVLQLPGTAARLSLPEASGAAADAWRAWNAVAPMVTVAAKAAVVAVPPPPPAAPAPVAAPPAPPPVAAATAAGLAAPGATPAMIDLTVPTSTPAGGTLVVTATPLDATGKAIPGAGLEFFTNIGSFGPVTEKDGVYSATLTVPKDATGIAKLSVVSEAGPSQLAKVTIGGAAPAPAPASPWGAATTQPTPAAPATVAAPTPAPAAPPATATPAPEATPKPPKAPAPAGDHPWLRARASAALGAYSYEHRPSDTPGDLLPATLSLGGGNGGAAKPVGFEVDARAWLPSLPYLGAHVQARSQHYSIATSVFDGKAEDWLTDIRVDLNGRYPFAVGADEFWVGAKAGFRYSDILLFEGCLTNGCTVTYSQVALPGLGVGPEVGAEIGPLFFTAAYELDLANFTTPYASAIDANIGYSFLEHVFADVGFGWNQRTLLLQSADTGEDRAELSDGALMIDLGVGVAF